MAANYWLKLYYEIIDDEKVMLLPVNLRWRFVECLILAGEAQEGGWLPDIRRFAFRARESADTIRRDLGQLAMEQLVELRVDDDGRERWYVTNYEKRQGPSKNALRQRRWRERQKEKEKSPTPPKEKEKKQITDAEAYSNVTSNVTRNAEALDAAAAAFTEVFGAPSIGGDQWVTKWQPTLESLLREHDGDIDAIRATFEAAYTVWDKRRKPAGGHYPANSPGAVAWAIAEVLRKEREPVAAPTLAQRINDAWRDHGPAFDRWPADLRDAAAAQDWRDHNLAIFNIVQAVRS